MLQILVRYHTNDRKYKLWNENNIVLYHVCIKLRIIRKNLKCKLKRVGVYCHGWKKVSIIWLERLSHISQWRYFFINKLTVWAFQGKKFILIYSYTEYGFSSNFGDKNTKIMHSYINRIENCVWPFLSGIIYITFVIKPLRCLKPCIENRHTFIYTVRNLQHFDLGQGGIY